MSRIIWRRAHAVRLPDKNSKAHSELNAAWIRDLFRNHALLEDRMARALEPVLAVFLQEMRT